MQNKFRDFKSCMILFKILLLMILSNHAFALEKEAVVKEKENSANISIQKRNKLELCYLPASTLLQLYRSGEVSPVEVLKAQIEQIEKLNPGVNAISYKHYEEAMTQAKESEKRYKEGNPRPLEGITCAIKDDLEVKGWQSSMGSLIRKDVAKSTKDGALVTLLRNTGVVMHVQTNVPEYYCNLVTWNKLFGISRNPWNKEYTPGGSSGGSAAALASGFTTLATGSDMGGSIRFPAAMTALYGFKPPYGRVATSLVQYESLGPMARTFDDMVLFQNAMTGPSPKMISSLRPKLHYPEQYESIKGWRIAYDPMKQWGVPVDESIIKAMNEVVQKLRTQGAIVEEVDLGFRASDFDTYAKGIFASSIGPFCFNEPEKNPEVVTAYIAYLMNEYAKKASPQHILDAENWIEAHSNEVQQKVFEKGYQAIIMPTMCTPYVTADMGQTPENTVVKINGKNHSSKTWNYSFTWIWNMLGQHPVVNVPIGVTKEGIPLGMQIIANTYDDLTAFQVASEWSKIAPNFYGNEGMLSTKNRMQ